MTAICCPQWGVPSGPWGKDQGDAVRASRASTGAREVGGGGSLILITLLLMVVFLWNALWRAFDAVMRKGTQAGNNIQMGPDRRGILEL